MREPGFETVFLLPAVTVVRERGPFLLQQAVNPFEPLLPPFQNGAAGWEGGETKAVTAHVIFWA